MGREGSAFGTGFAIKLLQAVETLGKFFDLLSCKLRNCWDVFCSVCVEFSWITEERNFVGLLVKSDLF